MTAIDASMIVDKLKKSRGIPLSEVKTHEPNDCSGNQCAVHNPSAHHMRDWPQVWRSDRGMVERICSHGAGHPDPDDLSDDKIHGCCGCCAMR